jgi:hypothetical protein
MSSKAMVGEKWKAPTARASATATHVLERAS